MWADDETDRIKPKLEEAGQVPGSDSCGQSKGLEDMPIGALGEEAAVQDEAMSRLAEDQALAPGRLKPVPDSSRGSSTA